MRKLNKIIRRGSLKKGDRIFRINTGLGVNGAGRENVFATVLRSHPDPSRLVVRFDDQSIRAVAWNRFYKAD
tara:strand:+ start:414 stop:629 length:216 start_codon:yes stop_codon:yes gene_type:complete